MPKDDHSNDSPQAKSESKSRRIPAPVITVVILIVAAGIFLLVHGNWNTWQSDLADQSTDDAYVRADVTALSTKASGLVARMAVSDYQHVDAGQLVASIRDDDY